MACSPRNVGDKLIRALPFLLCFGSRPSAICDTHGAQPRDRGGTCCCGRVRLDGCELRPVSADKAAASGDGSGVALGLLGHHGRAVGRQSWSNFGFNGWKADAIGRRGCALDYNSAQGVDCVHSIVASLRRRNGMFRVAEAALRYRPVIRGKGWRRRHRRQLG